MHLERSRYKGTYERFPEWKEERKTLDGLLQKFSGSILKMLMEMTKNGEREHSPNEYCFV